jgi:hypothetical protein
MSKSNQLTRTCSSCGIQKPLSAFLHLGGTQGTTYGTVCSDCRRDVIAPKLPALKDRDDSTSTSAGFRIGAKAKISAEMEKKRLSLDKKESNLIEVRKREYLKIETEINTEQKEKAEKEHRRFYLDTKKQSFLTGTKTAPLNKLPLATQTAEIKGPGRSADEKTRQLESKKLEEIIDNELKLTTIDLTLPFADPQVSEIRHHSSLFIQFKQWLGGGSPIGKASALQALEKLYTDRSRPEHEKKDPLIEYIDKTWGPSSSSRRR